MLISMPTGTSTIFGVFQDISFSSGYGTIAVWKLRRNSSPCRSIQGNRRLSRETPIRRAIG
jgi:hypothetical protein